jgi:predicted methyltransferase
MQRISLVNVAHNLISEALGSGAIAIDATVGNGHDTAFLVNQVGPSGRVFGFDIQQSAIASTLMKADADCLTLIQASHALMDEKIPKQHHGKISAIMFNLGYLPGGDKSIITQTASTLTALTVACRLLANGGIITVMAYPGHPGGDVETAQVNDWCVQLNPEQFVVRIFYSVGNRDSTPRLFVINNCIIPA